MKTTKGLWIDHRKAVIVPVTDKGEEVKEMLSPVEKQPDRLEGVRSTNSYPAQLVPADDSQQRDLTGHRERQAERTQSRRRDRRHDDRPADRGEGPKVRSSIADRRGDPESRLCEKQRYFLEKSFSHKDHGGHKEKPECLHDAFLRAFVPTCEKGNIP